MLNITRKNDHKKPSLASKMLTSAMPLVMVAMAPAAFANTATNTVTVSLPSYASDPTPENNTATDTDTVLAVVDATNDPFGTVNGADGTTTASVLDNDTLNGVAVDPADITLASTGTASDGTTALGLDTVPASGGITMTADGELVIAPGTTAGTYTYTYEICETLNPDNCAIATATVTVEAPEIDATNDPFGTVNGADGTTTASVLDNDTLNGVAVDPADITLASTGTASDGTTALGLDTVPASGGITMTADGELVIAPGTTAGTYTYTYEICETLNPDNCAIATATVTVEAPEIDATNDPFGTVNGADGTTTASVLDNDTLNGVAVDPADITLASTGTASDGTTALGLDTVPASGGITMTADGELVIAPGTTAGTYTYTYEICETLNPDNCAIATATVTVEAPEIDATNDPFGTVNGADGTTTASVLDNDTLNGVAVDPADITLASTGTASDGTTALGLDTVPASGGITMTADGELVIAPGTTAGTYTYTYEICETLNPDNCAIATATVTVEAPEIDATNDPFGTVNGADGTTTASVLDNDTLNGVAVDPADITLASTGTASDGTTALGLDTVPASGGITMTADGELVIAPGTTAGTYTYTYEICETLNPDNCAIATATVTVEAPEIDATNDPFGTVNGADGTTTASVLDNDTLNGVAVDPADITLASTGTASDGTTALGLDTVPASGGITMTADGELVIAPGTTAGTYTYTYEICETLNPDNCAIATATVTVEAPEIDATNDPFGTVNGADGTTTASVLDNDTLNGVAVDPADITLASTGTASDGTTALGLDTVPASGGITMTADGELVIAPGTTAGTYTYTYEICETLNPDNCAIATATVTVEAPEIDATNDPFGTVNGADGTTTASVLDNDTLNGVAVDPADITLASTGTASDGTTALGLDTVPASGGITMTADGELVIAPGTTAGTYTYTYEICETLNPDNCAIATATVTVEAPEIDATNDPFGTVNGADGTTTASVLDNDTLNGVAVDPADITLASTGTASDGTTALGLDTVPASGGITMTADGELVIAPGTTAGTYTYTYEICETLNPDNCAIATATVTVEAPEIDATNDPFGTVNGADGTTTASVLDNDTLNGVAVDPADITLASTGTASDGTTALGLDTVPASGGITMTADGELVIAPGTTAGTYTYTYEICETLNPDNCAIATATVTVEAPEIDATNDPFGTVNGADGTTTASVLDNDTLNGVAVDPADITLASTGTASDGTTALGLDTVPASGGITMTADGELVIAPGTTAGTYTYTYEICETLNPDNCAIATATVTVEAPEIDATNDPFGTVNGADGTTTASVLDNDTLNGVAVDPADITLASTGTASDGTTALGLDTVPASGGITMTADGELVIAPGTTAGTYTYTYEICETLNPDNCAIATATVTVEAPEIDATNDPFGTVNGADGTTTASVLDNDTLNGVAVDPADITLASTGTASDGTTALGLDTVPASGGITMTADGELVIAPGTTAGTYTYTYEICETLNPDNCAIATATVTVEAPEIDATNDPFGTVNGADGTTTASVLDNDTLNGVAVDPADITLASTGTASDGTTALGLDTVPASGGITMTADGELVIAPGTTAGTYTYTYEICETLNPDNCAIATATVTVEAPEIDATNDPFGTVNGADGTTTASVLDNDTLNGVAVDPADITLASTGTASDGTTALGLDTVPASGGITMTADGELVIAPGTTAGTYTYTYEICETLNPDNCAIATATVTVEAPEIDATNDPFGTVNGADGTTTASVLDNDTLNGVAVDPADITLASTGTASDGTTALGLDTVPASGGITMTADGELVIAPGTTAGTYTYTYEICETLNPDNCAIATATVTVEAPEIDATNDPFGTVNGADGTTTASVLDNDTLNGVAVDPADITLASTGTASDGTTALGLDTVPASGGITMTADGELVIAPGTTAGTYTYTYEICETLNPDNCAIATATVTVEAPEIDATNDPFGTVNGADGTTTASVLDNDTLNGVAVDPADITLASTGTASDGTTALGLDTVPASGGITMTADGELVIAPGTTAGTYTYTYEICETLNPDNCAIATATVTVEAPEIDAEPEVFPEINGADGGVTTSVLASDTLNGVAVDPADVSITATSSSDPNVTLDPATGLITVAPGTPAETYTVEYTICENNNPDNCATVVETVTVGAPEIDAEPEVFPTINGADGGVTTSVLASDTLNGVAVDPADVTLTVGASDPELTFDPATGLITVAPGTPAGTYTVEYTICENNNPDNCATVVETVTVEEAVIEATADTVSGIDSTDGGVGVINALKGDTLNGVPATVDTVTIEPAPGFTMPEGITLNPDGTVDVAPGTPAGTYEIEYQICEILNPTNCTTSTVTIVVEESLAVLSGVVYFDTNGNNSPDSDETVFAGWIVEIRDENGDIVAELVTDENGYYETELPFGNFTVSFINPDNGGVHSTTSIQVDASSKLPNETIEVIVNLPIDPSGVVYDSVSREPVENAVMTMVDSNGQPLPAICFIDSSQQNQTTGSNGYYRFDIVPGADASCPVGQTDYRIIFDAPESHLDTTSTIIGAQPGFLTTNAGSGPLLVAPTDEAPQNGEDTTHYFGFTLGTGSRDVINNHIPLDPITLVRSPMDVIKSSPRRDVNFGDLVPYTITVTNTEDIPRVDLDIIDFTPPGFKYVEDTSRLNGVEVDPEINGRELKLNDYDFAPNETKTWTMMMVVGASVSDGIYTNQAYVRDPLGSEVSDRAEAVVRVSPDPLFDCSELIGKVFDDKNKDGYQNEGEPGMAGVRLATAKGLLVTTDDKGRYHISCAAIPNGQIGSNFILKVDERTLPTGYHLTSENPRVVRLTRGKMSKANFGTALENIIRLDVTDAAYEFGSNTLRQEFSGQLGQIVDALKGQESTLKITYYPSIMGRDERIEELSSQIQELWEVYGGDYDLNIERKTVWPGGNSHQQSGAGE